MSRGFRLRTVLRVAELRERGARAALAAANLSVAQAAAELAVAKSRLDTTTVGGGRAPDFDSAVRRAALRADAVKVATDARDATTLARDAARATWSATATQRRGLEELRARHRAAALAEEERLAQRALDDRPRVSPSEPEVTT